ncbi:aldehyde dehydrogenase [Histoplasma capsulatum G186AR]|uniref:Aldehyde dehydrogenase n=2 Tax=Ajellomyces capsulatus TaxID=5037 RepID=C0NN99_AJECG|nr:aldehyde dehydrogenase [Histoplasma capsulatum G186AR]EEH07347.1 aldehyde dehydrogenase [Histoplasma capsulatum G186AR]KAG5304526.1 aldehyde dehydrogenase [Histoplasma capsulatum]QSS70124.1 aldehyde dehydrogenase [Histoplasma capsulatum G186AR]
MATVDLPTLQFTPVEEIPAKVRKVRTTFFQHKTRPIEFRIQQLRKLYWALKDREHLVVEALYRDLGKPKYETYVSEINIVENDIVFIQKNVAKWAKDEKAQNIDMPFTLMKPRIRKDPLGCVLVIGAFNVPFSLNILPLIGAIAAGNTVVVKPSESSPNCAAVLQEIIEAAIDPDVVSVVQGGATETQALLAERWDKICFTGNATVGRIVAQAAAPNLTPVLLELGGRNPAFITKKADVRLAARRLFWAKTFNAGQICLSQNYILVDKEIVSQLVTEFGKVWKEFYPDGVKASPDFCRIINDAAFRRIKDMIDSTKGKILLGGTMDEKERFIEPTLVQVDSADDPLVRWETFGPIITILPVGDLDEAIRISNDVDNTPLAAYAFGTKKEVEKVLSCVRSGGATINDTYMHGIIPNVPFGGVGESGSGAYHGRSSFDAFVHRRSIATTPGWVERMLSVRYPPYAGKLRSTLRSGTVAPNFDRSGRTTTGFWGWIIWFITFGGGANKSGASRAAVAVVAAIALNYYIKRRVKV